MSLDLRPLETRYHGYRFRSRLEARWARFLVSLRIPFEYEKEGYYLDGAYYLPDFWLPRQQCWMEVKGQKPTDDEQRKCDLLAMATKQRVFLVHGPIPVIVDGEPPTNGEMFWSYDGSDFQAAGSDSPYCWCRCPDCGAYGIEFDGRSDRLPCKEPICCAFAREKAVPCADHPGGYASGCRRHGANLDKGYTYNAPEIVLAYGLARSARFEHGEAWV